MRVFLLAVVTLASLAGSASAEERAEVTLHHIQSVALREADAANADFELVNAAGVTMHRAYRAGGSNMVAAIDAGLGPLRTKFPDKRLRYTGEQDRCRIFDAFSDIRSDALDRSQRALNVAAEAAMRLEIYYRIQADIALASMMSAPVTRQTISDSFMKTIDAEKELSVFAYNTGMDRPDSEPGRCE